MLSYKNSGVDQKKAKLSLDKLKSAIEKTHHIAELGQVLGESGGYSGLFRPKDEYQGYDLVATTDGVGTKIELCSRFSYLEPLGYDLVAMCVNDLYCSGALPAFFLDYVSCGKINNDWYLPIITSITKACEISKMALIGGETAEHPGIMNDGEFDLAGFCVGFVDKNYHLPNTKEICDGDYLIGLASNGLHSNGFSLVRMIFQKILEESKAEYEKIINNKDWIQKQLLAPTKIYYELPKLTKQKSIKAIAHITGGGIYENLPRILPDHITAVIQNKNAFRLPIYDWLSRFVTKKELFNTFNMGYGMILVASKTEAEKIILNKDLKAIQIGHIKEKLKPQEPNVIIEGVQ